MPINQTSYFVNAYKQNILRDASLDNTHIENAVKIAFFDITLTTVTLADDFILAPLPYDAYIIPGSSFLVGVSGTIAGGYTLEKVASFTEPSGVLTFGTTTAISGGTTLATIGTAVALGAATGAATGFPVVNRGEYLNLTISTAGAAAGAVLRLAVAYVPK
jgi:hypothetical protein